MSQNRSWAVGVIGNKVARMAVVVVALLFLGVFLLLSEVVGVIEPSPAIATIGVVLFVFVALPAGLVAGRRSDKALQHGEPQE